MCCKVSTHAEEVLLLCFQVKEQQWDPTYGGSQIGMGVLHIFPLLEYM